MKPSISVVLPITGCWGGGDEKPWVSPEFLKLSPYQDRSIESKQVMYASKQSFFQILDIDFFLPITSIN